MLRSIVGWKMCKRERTITIYKKEKINRKMKHNWRSNRSDGELGTAKGSIWKMVRNERPNATGERF